ncbi:MAG: DUF6789 family protein [Chloroflexota bacterium]
MTRLAAIVGPAAAGAVATAAMSVLMVAGAKAGMMGNQPPTVITRSALQAAGVDDPAVVASRIAPAAHLAFGALAGMLFGFLRRIVPSVPGPILGVLFGLGVWGVSYRGWVPALGILPPPERDRPGRPEVMVAAHLVFGLVLGVFVRSAPCRRSWSSISSRVPDDRDCRKAV